MRLSRILLGVVIASSGASAVDAGSILTIPPATAVAMRIVVLHNQTRSAVGAQPVYWDASLAAAADSYARELARTGRWEHSPQGARPGQGENLWRGTKGAFSVDQMVGSWGSELRWFRAGRFPEVSQSGSWAQVGHYTQMIWPTTSRVGCALRSSPSNDYLVCRYSPAGNVMGALVP